ncbi:X-Pro aminopeptidase [Galdieria sulphuraria]|uniref:X-Pro aminopeptidase n=1 Tax=Galdieria sulphuraria TaxID=130081 RepID=M2XVN7_GALSU|nr:X-Pro aminopeptidase [Galdieria sulphuraria]EME27474.1 X-Pro aminopeptidase [Galdieria sulphuraria]|eukprot:XP_005703994.1 X-Pro aminopeptidase [Galdieria sulphuraria]
MYAKRWWSTAKTNIRPIKSLANLFCYGVDKNLRSVQTSSSFPALEGVGQPTPETHPHLLAPGEIIPGITATELKKRRQDLLKSLPNNSMALFPAASEKFMSVDVPYPYRQSSDLFYLSGLTQPNVVLLLDKTQISSNHNRYEEAEYLFVPRRDPFKETWDGASCGVEQAQRFFGIAQADILDNFSKFLSNRLKQSPQVYFDLSVNPSVNFLLRDLAESDIKALLSNRKHTCVELALQRLIKSPSEQHLMLQSARILADSMTECMRMSYAGTHESFLAARIEYECKKRGAERMSFPPVVASGSHSNTLHYLQNSDIANDGDLVLMDAGCELHGYCSDVTRTWPVNGQFSKPQREVYELVLDVHNQCIDMVKNSHQRVTSLEAIHILASRWIYEGLEKLGIIRKTDVSSNDILGTFFPHAIGHYLGLDVHDTHILEKNLTLKPGMVITIEPGIYIPRNDPSIPEAFRGIGIRIEDDILVKEDGAMVLSENVPKQATEIELLMKERS